MEFTGRGTRAHGNFTGIAGQCDGEHSNRVGLIGRDHHARGIEQGDRGADRHVVGAGDFAHEPDDAVLRGGALGADHDLGGVDHGLKHVCAAVVADASQRELAVRSEPVEDDGTGTVEGLAQDRDRRGRLGAPRLEPHAQRLGAGDDVGGGFRHRVAAHGGDRVREVLQDFGDALVA